MAGRGVALAVCLAAALAPGGRATDEACDAPDLRKPVAAEDWMDDSDDFDGFRQLMHFPELRLAVSKTGKLDLEAMYECPDEEYVWATSRMVLPLMTGGRDPPTQYYLDLGGWEGLLWEGVMREHFLFRDSLEDGSSIKASEFEGLANTEFFDRADANNKIKFKNDLPQGNFAGIVCITKEAADEASALAEYVDWPDWMETTDAFYGFRQLRYFPEMRLAVAKSNRYDENFTYSCPSFGGEEYFWANGTDVESIMNGTRQPESKYYSKQGGWKGEYGVVWNNVSRFGFLFADSFENGHYIDSYDSEGQTLHELPSRGPEEQGLMGGELIKKRFTSVRTGAVHGGRQGEDGGLERGARH
eukprot:SAG22_NODE_637_length_8315_cov_16.174416_8_plen_358_part_00